MLSTAVGGWAAGAVGKATAAYPYTLPPLRSCCDGKTNFTVVRNDVWDNLQTCEGYGRINRVDDDGLGRVDRTD